MNRRGFFGILAAAAAVPAAVVAAVKRKPVDLMCDVADAEDSSSIYLVRWGRSEPLGADPNYRRLVQAPLMQARAEGGIGALKPGGITYVDSRDFVPGWFASPIADPKVGDTRVFRGSVWKCTAVHQSSGNILDPDAVACERGWTTFKFPDTPGDYEELWLEPNPITAAQIQARHGARHMTATEVAERRDWHLAANPPYDNSPAIDAWLRKCEELIEGHTRHVEHARTQLGITGWLTKVEGLVDSVQRAIP